MSAAANTHHEAVPTNTDANIAVMAVEVRYIKEAVDRMERSNEAKVSRNEWEQRIAYVDQRFLETFAAIGKATLDTNTKIAEIASDMASRRAPWWTIVAAGAGGIAVIAYLFDIIPQIVN